MAPLVKLRGVPEIHFRVVLPIPAQVGEPALGWRHAPGIIHPHEILREHDAALQLRGARIGAAGEIDHAALRPVIMPALGTGDAGGIEVRPACRAGLRRESAGERKRVRVLRRDTEVVRGRLRQRGVALPLHISEIAAVVDRPGELGKTRAAARDLGAVVVGLVPHERRFVFGAYVMRVGEVEAHLQVTVLEQWRLEPHRHKAQRRVRGGFNGHRLPGQGVGAVDDTRPQIQLLVDRAHILSSERTSLV